jgi:Tfp pilus assembly protein PilX
MMKHKRISINNCQQGFVSIMVTMVIMGILVLITVGFATLVRREQKQSLDRQLSTQAFYAAESGINDAVKAINDNPTALPTAINCTDDTLTKPPYNYSKTLNGAANVTYTCVLFNDKPNILEYSSVKEDNSFIVPLKSGAPISSITIGWKDGSDPTSPSTLAANSPSHILPARGTTDPEYNVKDGIGMVRATVMPVGPGGSIPDTNTLINNAKTFFLYPNSAGSNSKNYSDNGAFIDGKCSTPGTITGMQCESTINGLSGVDTAYLRIRAMYNTVSVKIAVNGGAASLSGAQIVVDSTGKAQDVLRRIQVRVPNSQSYKYSGFALQSLDTICKRMRVWPGNAAIDTPVGYGTICGTIPSSPAPPPPPGGGAGAAGVIICKPGEDCSGDEAPAGGAYHFTRTLYNNSNVLTGGAITGCSWSFGDGSSTVTNTACNPGDEIDHDYSGSFSSIPPYPVLCSDATGGKFFTVVLTENFASGPPGTATQSIYVPGCW